MLIDKLNQILNSEDESSVSYVISLFIKKNLKEIPELSINYIACSCHTSKSQISKYIKSLGYRTMKEFKTECMDNVSGFERTNITLFSLHALFKELVDSPQKRTEKTEEVSMIYL